MGSRVMIEERLADLNAKLKSREGKPGFKDNVEAIKAQIAELENPGTYRHGTTGRFVSISELIANPETTKRVEI